MILDLLAFGALVALALGRDDMQQLRAFEFLQRLQRMQQLRQVVTVDRAEIMEVEFLEQRGRHEHAFQVFFPALEEAPEKTLGLEVPLGAFAHRIQASARHQAREHFRQRADVLADRHLIVVEDHQHVGIDVAAVMQRFVGHAAGQTTVADDRDDLARIAFALRSQRHAQRSGNRSRGMADAKRVVRGFVALREWGEAVLFLDRLDAIATAGEDLVRIALVADIPHQPVIRCVV